MKKTTKWLTLVLSLILTTNSAVVYGAGDAPPPATTEETATIVADDEATLEPEVGEEIVEWREEGVRHYYLGDGVYQAVVNIDDPGVSTRATSPNSNAAEDTYISSATAATKGTNYGSSDQLWVGSVQTAYIYCPLPYLPDNATITDARLHFKYYYNISTGSLTLSAYPVNFRWREASLTWNIANNYANLGMGTTATGSATLSGTTSVTSKNINITSAVRSWYETQEITSFGIALKRTGGSNQSVILKSSESSSSYRPYMVITYGLSDLPVENGTYYIRNGQFHGLFMKAKNTPSNSSSSDDAATGVTPGDLFCDLSSPPTSNILGAANITWVFKYLHNGYYAIQSRSDNTYLTVRQGQENNGGKSLIREPFTGDNRQQWKITKTENHRYKIEPRSSEPYTTDWAMAASTIGGSTGYNVIQDAYNGTDSTKYDEWFIQSLNPTPQMSFTSTILYDALVAEKMGNVSTELTAEFEKASTMFLILYGIELKPPTVRHDPSIAVDSNCPVSDDPTKVCTSSCGEFSQCSTKHHTNVGKFVADISSDSERVCKVVGFKMCKYKSGEHQVTWGATSALENNKELVVGTEIPEHLNDTIASTMQHELSHTFGADDHEPGADSCVMNAIIDTWCPSCYTAISTRVENYIEYIENLEENQP